MDKKDGVINVQVGLLRIMGVLLHTMSSLSPSFKDSFHPFGFGLFSRWLGTAIYNPSNKYTITLRSAKEAKLSFYLNDMYWSSLVIPGVSYEDEIREILDHILVQKTTFIDCGANIGYWSVYATTHLKSEDIIAIEAFPPTYQQLLQNAALNGDFCCICAALSDCDGEKAWLGGGNHAGMSLNKDPLSSKGKGTWVETITLDTVYREHVPKETERIVVKLDVEGLETRVLSGAPELLERRPFIIYEEHGKENRNEASQFIREKLGYKIYYWFRSQGLQEISLDQINGIKRSRRVGYNFFACHPQADFWLRDLGYA